MKRFVLTGAPGAGKTSIINALAAMGHDVVPEAATYIIAQEAAKGIAEPWLYPGFIDKIIALQARRQEESAGQDDDIQFFDRSPVCTFALAIYLGFPPSRSLLNEMTRIETGRIYERRVLFVENLGFVEKTAARRINFEDSLVFERVHREAYQRFGYECVSIPAAAPPDRVNQVLAEVTP